MYEQQQYHQKDLDVSDKMYPRVLQYDPSFPSSITAALSNTKLKHNVTTFQFDPMLKVTAGEEAAPNDLRRKPYEEGDCVPMAEWQTQSFPNCNSIHEIGFRGSGEVDLFVIRKESENET
eukprot:6190925-Ditylum_brightwellii.AAC.1